MMGVMALFQLHFLQNACLRVRMTNEWGHLYCIDTFLVKPKSVDVVFFFVLARTYMYIVSTH